MILAIVLLLIICRRPFGGFWYHKPPMMGPRPFGMHRPMCKTHSPFGPHGSF